MAKIKLVFLILLNFVFLIIAEGQESFDIPQYIRQRFNNYCKSVPREEIFIHTDKDDYVSGEELWFNIYLINRQDFKPSLNSKIAYFEILNPDNHPVVQKRIFIEKGYGPGQIVLPDTLSSGTYTIRAYTNWMKNFLPQNCFMKDIQIYDVSGSKIFKRSIKSMDYNDNGTYSLKPDSGLIMKINNLKKDSLEIRIQTNEKFRSKNNNLINLFIQTHGIINHLSTEKTDGEITRISIPKKALSYGINQITIFDSEGPVCERYIYTSPEKRESLAVCSTDNCKKRNKIKLELEISLDSINNNDGANLSISVLPETNKEITDIEDYLIFGTEFGGIPGRLINGEKISELSPGVMDSLLLTIKSNWINWERIFSNDELSLKYPFEKENHYLSGILLNNKLQPAGGDEILIMSPVQKEAGFQYTRTNNAGEFNLKLDLDEDFKDLIIQPDILSKSQSIYIESSFSDQYIQNEVITDSINKFTSPTLARQILSYQVRNVFGVSALGSRIHADLQIIKSSRFYGKPDLEIEMKNYIQLDSLAEVFFELVPQVKLERVKSNYELSIMDLKRNKIEGSPCLMIDGVIIKDLSTIANLDPSFIDKIHVITSKYRVGGYSFNGIVNIISKAGVFKDSFMPVDAIKLHYNVIDSICSFASPDYSNQESLSNPQADYRNTLYWNPSVKTNKDGKATIEFWTSDIKANYVINIQGITSNGQTISCKKPLKVR